MDLAKGYHLMTYSPTGVEATAVALLHSYMDTMCLGILDTIGSLRPDSSLGLSSVYDVSALSVHITFIYSTVRY